MENGNWEQTKVTKDILDTVQTATAEFVYLSDKPIKTIKKTCSCTSYEWDENTLKVYVDIAPVRFSIPKGVYKTGKDSYVKSADLTVRYDDNTTEVLTASFNVQESKMMKNE